MDAPHHDETSPVEVESLAPRTSPEPASNIPPYPPLTAAGDGAAIDPAAEATIWTGRTHWRHYLLSVTVTTVGLVIAWAILIYAASRTEMRGMTAFLIGLLLTVLAGGAIGTRILLRVLQSRYRITNQRLFVERGILDQTIDQTELIRVDDVRVHKKFIDRLSGLGTIEVRSTDTTDTAVVIKGVKDPEQIAEHLRTSMRALRSRSLFVENL